MKWYWNAAYFQNVKAVGWSCEVGWYLVSGYPMSSSLKWWLHGGLLKKKPVVGCVIIHVIDPPLRSTKTK